MDLRRATDDSDDQPADAGVDICRIAAGVSRSVWTLDRPGSSSESTPTQFSF